MVCSIVKKGVLGAALSAGALYLAFGTLAPTYMRTAFHKVRHSAKDAVPVQFEIDVARDQIAALEPAILENRETLARSEVDVEHLDREIATIKTNLEKERKGMVALRENLKTGDMKLAKNSSVSYTTDEVRGALAQRLDHYNNVKKILENREATLKARKEAVVAARAKLADMAAQRESLATKLEAIQAQLESIQTAADKNEFHFDDSALARAKQSVSDLERRLEVKARVAAMEGNFPGAALNLSPEPGRDVVKEFDEQFTAPESGTAPKTGDKSL